MLNDRSRFLRGSSYREESSFLARVIVCRAEGGAKRIEEHLVYDTRADVARVRHSVVGKFIFGPLLSSWQDL